MVAFRVLEEQNAERRRVYATIKHPDFAMKNLNRIILGVMASALSFAILVLKRMSFLTQRLVGGQLHTWKWAI
jgi:hypothetical protein